MTDPKLTAIQDFFAAYAAKDVAAVKKVMAEDICWTIPGHHPLAGTKEGIDEVLAFFDQLAKANFKAEPLVLAVSGDYVLDNHRGWSEEAGGLDLTWCLVFRFENGKIKEVVNYCSDQHQADLFFNRVYRLAKIPDRLDGGVRP
jgi:ketosteroid isomerase-like protein